MKLMIYFIASTFNFPSLLLYCLFPLLTRVTGSIFHSSSLLGETVNLGPVSMDELLVGR